VGAHTRHGGGGGKQSFTQAITHTTLAATNHRSHLCGKSTAAAAAAAAVAACFKEVLRTRCLPTQQPLYYTHTKSSVQEALFKRLNFGATPELALTCISRPNRVYNAVACPSSARCCQSSCERRYCSSTPRCGCCCWSCTLRCSLGSRSRRACCLLLVLLLLLLLLWHRRRCRRCCCSTCCSSVQ
jgi:hypothetical protein